MESLCALILSKWVSSERAHDLQSAMQEDE
jgi:hypothetical protein